MFKPGTNEQWPGLNNRLTRFLDWLMDWTDYIEHQKNTTPVKIQGKTLFWRGLIIYAVGYMNLCAVKLPKQKKYKTNSVDCTKKLSSLQILIKNYNNYNNKNTSDFQVNLVLCSDFIVIQRRKFESLYYVFLHHGVIHNKYIWEQNSPAKIKRNQNFVLAPVVYWMNLRLGWQTIRWSHALYSVQYTINHVRLLLSGYLGSIHKMWNVHAGPENSRNSRSHSFTAQKWEKIDRSLFVNNLGQKLLWNFSIKNFTRYTVKLFCKRSKILKCSDRITAAKTTNVWLMV